MGTRKKTRTERETERVLRAMNLPIDPRVRKGHIHYYVGEVRVLVLQNRGSHDFIEHETRYQITRALREAQLVHQ